MTHTKGLKAKWGHSSRASSVNLLTVALVFNLIPSGGSVTTLSDFYNNPKGNKSVGYVVNQSLKSLCGFSINSIYFSKDPLSQSGNKWQFYSINQWPL